MSDAAEQVMDLVWGRIIGEVRKMRDEKYTLERIGTTLGVAKPTVQRWLENDAGGEKTAFIDILRYLKALNIDLSEIIYGDEIAAKKASCAATLDKAHAEKERMALELVEVQRELLLSQQKVIELQDKVIGLEKLNADIADKARKAIIAAASGKKSSSSSAAAAVVAPTPQGHEPPAKRRLAPDQFPDLPPIHLKQGK